MEERLSTGWTDSELSWWTALTASGWRPALTLTLARLGGELTSADPSTSLTSSSPPLRVYLVFLWSYHSFFSVCTYGSFIIFLWSFQSDLDKPTPSSPVVCSGLSSSSVLDLSLAGAAASIIFVAIFVATKVCIPRQNIFVATNIYTKKKKRKRKKKKKGLSQQAYFCRDKSMLVAKNTSLSRRT